MTELQTLKKKKKEGKASPEELTRLKLLQDGEPLSAADLAEAKKREEERATKDKADYEAKQQAKVGTPAELSTIQMTTAVPADVPISAPATTLDPPPEHPRIVALKEALLPFTQIEADVSRPNEFVLFTRGVAITAGDVRKACKAMKL